jgi:uncharacterized protein
MADANILGGLLGGALIGGASILLLLLAGRVAGISGVLGGIVTWRRGHVTGWRFAFLGGLVLGAALYRIAVGPLPLQMQADGPLLAVAGGLVGFGTRLGAGCTSGHGVCGIARRSPRSVVATVVFIAIAMLTVYVTHWATR